MYYDDCTLGRTAGFVRATQSNIGRIKARTARPTWTRGLCKKPIPSRTGQRDANTSGRF